MLTLLLSDAEVEHNASTGFTVIRHNRPFVVYQGLKTTVPISVLGAHSLPKDRRVFLQKRGYRTGLLGWSLGSALGGSKLPGIEVTPTDHLKHSAIAPSTLASYASNIARLVPSRPTVQQTLSVHIPVASGDGYFRLLLTKADGRTVLAVSPVFRVGSISWRSAQIQGATLFGLVPEFAVKSLFVGAETSAYAAFYATFPFLKLASYTPGPWREWALRTLYSGTGVEEKFNVTEKVEKAKGAYGKAYGKVPFGAVGVRTQAEIIKDEEKGRGGVWYDGPGL
ncbi:hypothetical protein PLICRDRAFT_56611 [Plicaturopsis crispa FD-325 SS-3]|nr:hypothetical protein PLICRDRAFT_56611 [Plicaturopsis crispa FD-325 SS-3]